LITAKASAGRHAVKAVSPSAAAPEEIRMDAALSLFKDVLTRLLQETPT